ALRLARRAESEGEVPVGAVIVRDGGIIAEGTNRPISTRDPTAHAEMVALRAAAGTLDSYRLPDTTLSVTLEPCTMCAGALGLARVRRVVFGAWEPRTGAVGSLWDVLRDRRLNHRPEVVAGVLAAECAELLEAFFETRR
ncbi:MAG: tRNA adenosine(34) deaminase TadA, partial [Pseudonocardia sp.]